MVPFNGLTSPSLASSLCTECIINAVLVIQSMKICGIADCRPPAALPRPAQVVDSDWSRLNLGRVFTLLYNAMPITFC